MHTHIIKQGFGYWDVTNYPVGGSFKRAKEDLPVTVTEGPAKTSHGYLCFFKTADGRRVAAGEQCFEEV